VPVEIEAPDGSVVEFPDGTPPDVMTRAMRAKFGGPSTSPAPASPSPAAPPRPDTRTFRAPILPNTQPSDVSRTMGEPTLAGGRAGMRSAVPAAAGAAAFGPGFVAGGTLGAGLGGPIGGLVLGLGGGLATAMGGSYLAQKAQNAVTSFIPDSVKQFFGQDDATIAADTKQFPVATTIGAAAPNLAFMRPGFTGSKVAAEAPLLERVLASPATGAAVGGTLGGGIEAGSEFATEGKIDPSRVITATAIGALLNRPTKLGENLMVGTGNATIRGMQATARTAGTVTRGAQAVAADIAQKARNAYGLASEAVVDVTATPVAPVDAARLPGPVAPEPPPIPPATTRAPSPLVEGSLPAPMQSPPTGGDGQGATRKVFTPTGDEIETRLKLIDAGQARYAEGVMQNRDRDRAGSEAQIMNIIGDFRPQWLGEDNFSDRGAPIIGPEGVIESGNGRMMALNRIYDERPELATAYKEFIKSQGFNPEGMERPVLVRERLTAMDDEQLRRLVTGSNSDTKMRLSAVEQSRQDASDILAKVADRYLGGSVTSQRNGDFVRSFIDLIPQGERSQFMDKAGGLSTDGVARIENALLARAFGNSGPTSNRFLSLAMEQTDNQTRTLTGALSMAAPVWGRMTDAVKEGRIPAEYDLTDKVLQAIAAIADTKGSGESVKNLLQSEDMYNSLDPTVRRLIEAWHSDKLQMRSKQKIADFLERYAQLAEQQRPTPDMFGDVTMMSREDLLNTVIGEGQEQSLFGVAAEERLPGAKPVADALSGISRDEAAAIASTPLVELKRRDQYIPPSNTAAPTTDFERFPIGSAKIGINSDPKQAYVEVLRAIDPEDVFPTEREEGIRGSKTFKDYVEWARQGIEPPPISVYEDENGRLTTSSRRRVLAAREAGAPEILAWVSPHNSATGLPLKYGDVLRATTGEANDTNRAQGRDEGGNGRAPGEDEFTGSESERQRSDGSAPQRRDQARGPRADNGQRDGRSVRRGRRTGAGIQEDAAKLAAQAEVDDGPPDYSEGRPPAAAEDRGAYQPSFMEASFTNRSSLYEYAVTDIAGITSDEFRLKSPEAQVALMQRGMMAKFGISVSVDPQLQRRFAIDQMLDAYQNMQGMAHILGIAPEAMSLGGRLSLRLERKVRALGWFQPGKNVIGLPKRSNSFAHEWGHALDWQLLELYGGDAAEGRGLTGDVRKQGADFEPRNVEQAFVKLLNAMFFDEAAMATKMMILERRIQATESDKQKAQFQAQIDNYRSGRSRAKEKSAFYQGARVLDRGPDGYFASPTEMFARAFEAYTSYQAERRGLGTEFIGKGDANYLSNAEERFAKAFPKGEEREAIFAAFDDLFVELNREAVLGDGPAAEAPRMTDLRKITDFDRLTRRVPTGGLMRREMDAITAATQQRAKALAGRPENPEGIGRRVENLVANVAYSMTGLGRMMERRYPQAPAIKELIDKLTYREGKGQYVGEGFESAARSRSNVNHNRLAEILRRHDLENMTAEQDRMLRDILIGEPGADAPENMTAGAAALRRLLDEEFYANQNAGLDIGYARNGYLPRMLDLPLVLGDEVGFTDAAGDVYKVVFDNEFGADPQELLAGENFPTFMRMAARFAKAGLVDAEAVKAIRDIARKLSKVDDPEGDGAGISAELQNELEEALAEIFDPVRDAYAAERAAAWLAKLKLTSDMDFDAHSPDSDYTKNRSLPPEADKIMEAFYIQNPVEAIHTYLGQSARRTEYAKLFGPKGEKRKELFEAMAAQGVSKGDQAQLATVLDIATGRVRSNLPAPAQGALSFIQASGIITLLPRAVLSSLTEAITAGLRTGDFTDGFKALTASIAGAMGSPNGKQRAELARALGIVVDSLADDVNAARFGGTFGDDTKWTKLTSTMFRRTGLTGLTRSQRTHMLAVSNAFMDLMVRRLAAGEDVANSRAMLLELGIRDPDAFAREWMERGGGLPSVDDLDTPFGQDYGVASRRFIDQTIQNPTLMDRPVLANNPVGRVMFGIMSFSYSFWRNIVKRNGILLREQAKRSGGARAAKSALGLLGAAAALFALQGTVSTIREYLLNRNRWRELEEKGELEKTMAQLAFTRSFSFGAADPFIQAYTGLKYQRDLSNVFVGAAPGFFLQNTQKMIMPAVRNSDKTNTAEYGAVQGAYSTFAAPALAFGLMSIPGGPIIQGATGIGVALGTAPVARDAVATAIVGEKDKRGKKKHSASP
jgi:hypothetical protein